MNEELADNSLISTQLPLKNIGNSSIFCRQFLAMNDLYKSQNVQDVLKKIDAEIEKGRFIVSNRFFLENDLEVRKDLAAIFLKNYNPLWLLFALSVVLRIDFESHLDNEIQSARDAPGSFNPQKILAKVVDSAINSRLLSYTIPGTTLSEMTTPSGAMRGRGSLRSQRRDLYNGVILSRMLHIIFLLDHAKLSAHKIVTGDPPLFRYGSKYGSSKEIVHHLGLHYMQGQGNVIQYLRHRRFIVSYEAPAFDRMQSLFVKNLLNDLVDGRRLCKLASVMLRDQSLLSELRKVREGMTKQELRSCHLSNVGLAMKKMQEYASSQMKGPFNWKGTQTDIVDRVKEKSLDIVWQVVSLWLEVVVLNRHRLEAEIKVVQQQFRESGTEHHVDWSPGKPDLGDVSPTPVSPTQLTVYENCDSVNSSLLLQWCMTVAAIYGIEVREYTESFRSGAALCVILRHYYPELIQTSEIIHVGPAGMRPANDSVTEIEEAQSNFDLFTDRCRLLGGIPHIPLSAEAACAPSFGTYEKAASFGRVVELLASYLFKRVVAERDGVCQKSLVKLVLCKEPLTSREERSSNISKISQEVESELQSPAQDRPQSGLVTDNVQHHPSLNIDNDQPGNLDQNETESYTSTKSIYPHKQACQQPPRSLEYENSTAHESRRDSGSSGSVLDGEAHRHRHNRENLLAKQDAARKIWKHYHAKKLRLQESALQLQAATRGFLARHKRKKVSAANHPPSMQDMGRPSKLCDDNRAGCPTSAKPVPSQQVFFLGSVPEERHDPGSTQLSFIPGNVVADVVNVLPGFRSLSSSIFTFAVQMQEHEKTMAASRIQIAYRALKASSSLQFAHIEASERQKHKKVFNSVLSGMAETAKAFFAASSRAMEEQKNKQGMLICHALQMAKQAYEAEMSRAEASKIARIKQQEERISEAQRREENDNSALEALHADCQSLEDFRSNLDARLDSIEGILDSNDLGVSGSMPVEARSCRISLTSSGTAPDDDTECNSFQGQDHEVEVESAHNCEREIILDRREYAQISADLDRLHAEWDAELEAKKARLDKFSGSMLRTGLDVAERYFNWYMDDACHKRCEIEKRSRILTLNLANLQRDEDEERIAYQEWLEKVDGEMGMPDVAVSEAQLMADSLSEAINGSLARSDAILCEIEDLEEIESNNCRRWNISVGEFEADIEKSASCLRQYEEWVCTEDEVYDAGISSGDSGSGSPTDSLSPNPMERVEEPTMQMGLVSPGDLLRNTSYSMSGSQHCTPLSSLPDIQNPLSEDSPCSNGAPQKSLAHSDILPAMHMVYNHSPLVPVGGLSSGFISDEILDCKQTSHSMLSNSFQQVQIPSNINDGSGSQSQSGTAIFPDGPVVQQGHIAREQQSPLSTMPISPAVENRTGISVLDAINLPSSGESLKRTPLPATKITSSSPSPYHAHVLSSLDKRAVPAPERALSPVRNLSHSEPIGVENSKDVRLLTPSSGSALDAVYQQCKDMGVTDCSSAEMQEMLDCPSSAEKIAGIFRRLSAAISTPGRGDMNQLSARNESCELIRTQSPRGESREKALPSIVNTVFMVIRQYSRSEKQIALVKLGLSIIEDLSTHDDGVEDIFTVEDCMDVLIGCVQIYRDNESIACSALEVLLALTSYSHGEALICADENLRKRLDSVHAMLLLEREERQHYADQMRRLDIVMQARERQRNRESDAVTLVEEIELLSQSELRRIIPSLRSVGLLEDLVEQIRTE